MTHYMTLLSDASLSVFPDNTLSRFRVRLARSVNIGVCMWEVGLCELIYPEPPSRTDPRPIFVYCDLIEPRPVGDSLVRCLRVDTYPAPGGHHVFRNVYYVPVEDEFQTVAIEILDKMGRRVPFPDSREPLVLVLHFRRRGAPL